MLNRPAWPMLAVDLDAELPDQLLGLEMLVDHELDDLNLTSMALELPAVVVRSRR